MDKPNALQPGSPVAQAPRRVVALGGGTGLPVILRGLRSVLPEDAGTQLTAVVTMTDDGGSSGRLRKSLGMPPPGDVRNCLVALSEEEDLLSGLFQHRYSSADELGGHNLGNLILAALAEQTGSFLKAVEVSSRVLRTVGRILPATLDDVTLVATLDDGSRIHGETAIDACDSRICRVSLDPGEVTATPGVVEAILGADLVVLGPGSLYTSIIPNLVVGGVAEALQSCSGAVVMVANLVTERDTRNLTLTDHLSCVAEHAGEEVVDALLVHEGPVDREVRRRYAAEGARSLVWEGQANGVAVLTRELLAHGPKQRHDSRATGLAILDAWNAVRVDTSNSGYDG